MSFSKTKLGAIKYIKFTKKLYKRLYIAFSMILLIFDRSEIGLQFLGTVFEPDLNFCNTLANFKQLGYTPSSNAKFISLLIIGAI